VWALLAQIIQDLTAAADTNAVALADQSDAVASDHEEGDAVASDPEEGDAAEDLAALADLLKQLQESPAALTAEGAIPLDRLRQMLEKWQAGANESQTAGLPAGSFTCLKTSRMLCPALPGTGGPALARSDGLRERFL
jgi:uncharacterized membrane protein YccC